MHGEIEDEEALSALWRPPDDGQTDSGYETLDQICGRSVELDLVERYEGEPPHTVVRRRSWVGFVIWGAQWSIPSSPLSQITAGTFLARYSATRLSHTPFRCGSVSMTTAFSRKSAATLSATSKKRPSAGAITTVTTAAS